MKTSLLCVLGAGLISRVALAPLTGHPYDMAIWGFNQRIFYQTGVFDFTYFPTLPIIYYLQLASYSFYAFVGYFGFHDSLLFYHTTYAVESVFLKLPIILADVGIFLLLTRSGKIVAGSLYFLNPLSIFLSSAWGTYDSIMLLCLIGGFLATKRNNSGLAALAFSISGLVKLFGFVPLGLMMIKSLMSRQFKTLVLQLGILVAVSTVVLGPTILQGGFQNLSNGVLIRFLGFSGAQTKTWNIFSALQGSVYAGAPPYIWIAFAAIPLLFVLKLRKSSSEFLPLLQSTLVGAILLNIFSQSEPQWLSWPMTLAMMYGSVTSRQGLTYFSYVFGTIATFLTITLTQGSTYVLFGLLYSRYLFPLEGFAHALTVYAITILSMLLILTGYVISRPVKFRFEVLALVLIVYAQAFVWLTIFGLGTL